MIVSIDNQKNKPKIVLLDLFKIKWLESIYFLCFLSIYGQKECSFGTIKKKKGRFGNRI